MNVISLTIISVVLYSIFAIFLSRIGGKINANLGAAIFTGLGMIIPIAYYLYEKLVRHADLIPSTPLGILYATLAGIAIAIWNVLVIIIFSKGGNLSFVFPVIYGAGAIAIPSIVGWLFFKETVSLVQGGGLVLVLLGVALIIISKI